MGKENKGDESDGEEDCVIFDEENGVWRCVYCQWEVEADNDEDGNCHCKNERDELHYLDFSPCLDYAPADSCSSGDESSDEEPNSEDERFVDDENTGIEDVFDAGTETMNLAAIFAGKNSYTSWESKVMEAAKSAKAAKVEQEKAGHERATTSEQTQTFRRPRSQAMIRPRGTTEGGKIFQDKDFAGEAKRAKSEGMTINAQGNPQAGNLAADKENCTSG